MKNFIIFCVLICYSLNVIAEDSISLKKDEKAPYTGILIPIEKLQELKQLSEELNIEKLITESYKKSIDLYKINEEIYKTNQKLLTEQNQTLSETLVKTKGLSDFEKMAWFIGGILFTGFSIWTTTRLLKN